MLLITDYHTIGSLYDFLKNYELTEEQLVRFICLMLFILPFDILFLLKNEGMIFTKKQIIKSNV